MAPKYYGASVARGYAAGIWAAEVLVDYETKARKADRKFNGLEYVRSGPPGLVLNLLRSTPPTIVKALAFGQAMLLALTPCKCLPSGYVVWVGLRFRFRLFSVCVCVCVLALRVARCGLSLTPL